MRQWTASVAPDIGFNHAPHVQEQRTVWQLRDLSFIHLGKRVRDCLPCFPFKIKFWTRQHTSAHVSTRQHTSHLLQKDNSSHQTAHAQTHRRADTRARACTCESRQSRQVRFQTVWVRAVLAREKGTAIDVAIKYYTVPTFVVGQGDVIIDVCAVMRHNEDPACTKKKKKKGQI